MKKEIQTIRLLVCADQVAERNQEIAPEFVAQVEQARAHLRTMSGDAVMNALLACLRSSLNFDLELHLSKSRATDDKSKSKRPFRR